MFCRVKIIYGINTGEQTPGIHALLPTFGLHAAAYRHVHRLLHAVRLGEIESGATRMERSV